MGSNRRCSKAALDSLSNDQSAILAMVLPHTQKLDLYNVSPTLFYFASKWLVEPLTEQLTRAEFKLARRSVGRLATELIDYRFPRE